MMTMLMKMTMMSNFSAKLPACFYKPAFSSIYYAARSQGSVEEGPRDEAPSEQVDGPPLPVLLEDYQVVYIEFQGRYLDEVDFRVLASCRSRATLAEVLANNSRFSQQVSNRTIELPVNGIVNWISSQGRKEATKMTIENKENLNEFLEFYSQEKFWADAQDSSDDEESDDESEQLKVVWRRCINEDTSY